MLVCPLCRIVLAKGDAICPREGQNPVARQIVAVPPSLSARFQILEVFADGDAGTLYLADDKQTGRRGILKLLRGVTSWTLAERGRLKRELVKQATLAHPALAVPLATGEADNLLWLFREWFEGVTLAVRIARSGALAVPEALAVAAQIAGALDALHRAGLLHRDLSPGHVIVRAQPSGVPKVVLIDAGIAMPIPNKSGFEVTGKPGYVSPEHARGKLVSFRSDLYSLGCLLYEMLNGQPPFRGSVDEVLEAHCSQAVPPLRVPVPTGVATLLAQLLSKDPRDRPFSAQQVRRALEPFVPQGVSERRDQTVEFAVEQVFERRASSPPPTRGTGTLRPPAQKRTVVGVVVPKPAPGPGGGRHGDELSEGLREDRALELTAEDLEPASAVSPSPGSRSAPPPPPVGRAAREKASPSVPPPVTPPGSGTKPGMPAPPEAVTVTPVSRAPAGVGARAWGGPPEAATVTAVPTAAISAAGSADAVIPTPERAVAKPVFEARLQEGALESEVASPSRRDEGGGMSGVSWTHSDAAFDRAATPEVGHPSPASSILAGPDCAPTSERTAADVAEETRNAPSRLHLAATDMPPITSAPSAASVEAVALDPAATERVPKLGSVLGPARSWGVPWVFFGASFAMCALTGVFAAVGGWLYFHAADRESVRSQAAEAPPALRAPPPARLPESASETIAPRMSSPTTPNASSDVSPRQPLGNPSASTSAAEANPSSTLVSTRAGSAADATAPDELARGGSAPAVSTPRNDAPAQAPAMTPNPSTGAQAGPRGASPLPSRPSDVPGHPRTGDGARSVASRSGGGEGGRGSGGAVDGPMGSGEARTAEQLRDEAREHFAAQRYREAARAYEQAARSRPREAGLWAGLGAARLQGGDARGAIEAYRQALSIDPNNPRYHVAMGRALLAAGDRARARQAFEVALRLDPGNREARELLSRL